MNVVSDTYMLGVPKREVKEPVEAMGAKGMSRSKVSRISATSDEAVRPVEERLLEWAYPQL